MVRPEQVTIRFRFFQVATSVIADERRSLALFHVDGTRVRFAWNQDDPPPTSARTWPAWRRYIEYLRGRAAEIEPTEEGLLSLGPEGMAYGGSYWSPVRCGATRYPDAQFLEMVHDARLVVPPSKTTEAA